MDEKEVSSIDELVGEMNRHRGRRPARRRCPGYSVGDVVEIMLAEDAREVPRADYVRIHHIAYALGLDREEAYERLFDPIERALSRRRRGHRSAE
jgi:hypothetical protein